MKKTNCRRYAEVLGDAIDLEVDGGDSEELKCEFLYDVIVGKIKPTSTSTKRRAPR